MTSRHTVMSKLLVCKEIERLRHRHIAHTLQKAFLIEFARRPLIESGSPFECDAIYPMLAMGQVSEERSTYLAIGLPG
jgi:hypothetical protein